MVPMFCSGSVPEPKDGSFLLFKRVQILSQSHLQSKKTKGK